MMHTKAARLIEHGEPLVVGEVDLPEPQPGELLVQLSYSGVNPVDRYAALGRISEDAPLPRTIGMEGVGTVDGRPVLVHGHGIATDREGLWAGAAVVPEGSVIAVPDGVGQVEAAAMGVAGVTAWRTVTELAQITAGDRVLVLGASGGVGSMVVTACHALGASVCGQTGSQSNESWISELGADRVLVGQASDLASAMREWQPTAVFDPLGGDFTGAALEVMAPHGRLVIFGTSADAEGRVPLQSLYRKGLSIFGYAGLLEPEERMGEGIRSALEALAGGRLRVMVDTVIPLSEVNEALGRLADRSTKGKLVLDLTR